MAEQAEERISPKNPEKAAKSAAAQAAQATQAAPAASTPAVPAERVATAEKAAAEKAAAMAFAAERIATAERIAAAEQKEQFKLFQNKILGENLKLEQENSEYKSTIHDKNKKAEHREKQLAGADEYAEEANDRAFATAKQLT